MIWNKIWISEGTELDVGNIAELSASEIESGLGWSWNPNRVRAAINHPRTVVLVAKVRSQFSGFGIMNYYEGRANLSLLAVINKFRNRGIGTKLVAELQKVAERNEIENLYIQVRESNLGAKLFYEKLGYEMIDLAKGYYRKKENAVIMYNYVTRA